MTLREALNLILENSASRDAAYYYVRNREASYYRILHGVDWLGSIQMADLIKNATFKVTEGLSRL